MNEVRILASLNDKHIISYKEAFYSEEEGSLCIVMEYAGGGDIREKIKEYKKQGKHLSEPTVWKYLRQLIKGLNTLHSNGILHRDIKSANIFLKED